MYFQFSSITGLVDLEPANCVLFLLLVLLGTAVVLPPRTDSICFPLMLAARMFDWKKAVRVAMDVRTDATLVVRPREAAMSTSKCLVACRHDHRSVV